MLGHLTKQLSNLERFDPKPIVEDSSQLLMLIVIRYQEHRIVWRVSVQAVHKCQGIVEDAIVPQDIDASSFRCDHLPKTFLGVADMGARETALPTAHPAQPLSTLVAVSRDLVIVGYLVIWQLPVPPTGYA